MQCFFSWLSKRIVGAVPREIAWNEELSTRWTSSERFSSVVTQYVWIFLYLGMLALGVDFVPLIVNDAIGASSATIVKFGFEFGQVEYLILLCIAFLIVSVAFHGVRHHIQLRSLKEMEAWSQALVSATKNAAVSGASTYRRALVFLPFEGEALARYLSERNMNFHLLVGATIITFIGLSKINLYLTAFVLIPTALVAIVAFRSMRRVKKLAAREVDVIDLISSSIDDASDYEPQNKKKILGQIAELLSLRAAITRFDVNYQGIIEFINPIATASALGFGGLMAIQGHLQIGHMFAVFLVANELQGVVREVSQHQQAWIEANARLKYLKTLVEESRSDDN